MYPNLPIKDKGVSISKGNNGGTIFTIDDNKVKNVNPCFPGVVTEINGKEVTVSHEDFLRKDYVTIYSIDGDIKVKENSSVGLKSVLGTTDKEIEFLVLKNNKYIDSKSFFKTSFSNKNQQKYGSSSTDSQVKCLVQNIIAIPRKLIKGVEKDEPCSLYRNDKEKDNKEKFDLKNTEDKKIENDGNENTDNQKWEFNQDFSPSTNSQPLPNQKAITEEISRIKELLRL